MSLATSRVGTVVRTASGRCVVDRVSPGRAGRHVGAWALAIALWPLCGSALRVEPLRFGGVACAPRGPIFRPAEEKCS